jgi:NADH dehydrogenase [ubiquinone] 1 alpha subcomplex assembly factor 7
MGLAPHRGGGGGARLTPLGERLVARIRGDGPITIADYMAACLGDPQYGYYMRRDPFGRGGDFITAPEVSQVFGELIGAWSLATWEAIGAPAPLVLAELGPGRGTLMADILRTARLRPRFLAAARVHLIEISPRLRDVQRIQLTQSAERLAWIDRVEDLPAGPLILVANEFFDALPIRQYVRTPNGWAERMVGVGQDGQLTFGLRPADRGLGKLWDGDADTPIIGTHSEDGDRHEDERRTADQRDSVIEVSPARAGAMAALAERIRRDGGAALVIDYGYEGPAYGDTLQAVRQHRHDNPLARPGEADLTAHVDFAALAEAARSAGAAPRTRLSQGEFLYRLGLAERASELARGKDAATQADIEAAVARLAGPTAMGKLFKVLAISSPGLALPAFDDNLPG